MAKPKYRLKRKYRLKKKIVLVNGRGYLVDGNFHANHKNADQLIESSKALAECFENNTKAEGVPVDVKESSKDFSKDENADQKAPEKEEAKQKRKPGPKPKADTSKS